MKKLHVSRDGTGRVAFAWGLAQAQTVGQDMKDAGHDTAHASKTVAHKTVHGTKVAAHDTEHGTKVAAHDGHRSTRHEGGRATRPPTVSKEGLPQDGHGTKHVVHKIDGKPSTDVAGDGGPRAGARTVAQATTRAIQ